ncbi:MAG TPA: cytochrome c3 family protein, partial [Isosphaeraceae bacterium]|nr:cytochrome c3 family protein [Isosphaeraceae bacterium]
LPDFVYFNHAIHIQKGIGCVSCHGRVDKMPIMWKEEPLTMEWCLECHRHPERHLREKREVFNMEWAPPVPEQLEIGRHLIEREHIEVDRLTNCSVCHR